MKFPTIRLQSALRLGGLSVPELVRRTYRGLVQHELMTRASAISFYAMLASVPFLALVLTFAVRLLPDLGGGGAGRPGIGNQAVAELRTTVERLVPEEAAPIVEDQIKRLQQPRIGLVSIGLAVILWTASSLFMAVIDAMNVIHGVPETRPYWKLRLLAMLMTILQAAVLLGALVAIVAWPWIMDRAGLSANFAAILGATLVQWAVLFVMVVLSFALAFYVGPDAEQRWEWITPGSLVGTVLFLLASLGFRLYVERFASYADTYGSLGGVMILLFWFWISALVLLCAAEMNQVIESASPLGKDRGQKVDFTQAPDFESIPPEPWRDGRRAGPMPAAIDPVDSPAGSAIRGGS